MKGTVVYLYAFDLANEIRTSQVREVLSQKPFPFQIRLGAAAPKDVPIYSPLTISLKPLECETSVGALTLKPFVKVFDVGAISISYEAAFNTPSIGDLVPYHQLRIGKENLGALAERLAAEVARSLAPFMSKPNPERPPVEAYTAFCLSDVGAPVPDWVRTHRAEIAGLLNEESESGRLAERQIDETLSHALAYTREDFTVVDWDAALVVDTSGYVDDVLFIIELANLQLEEFRLLDDRLDRLFLRAYEDLERESRLANLLFASDERLSALRRIRMDITKMSEELSNITKFVGDWYLARVYLSCKHRFHLGHWEASVDQKLHEIDRLYTLVHQGVNEKRMLLLELVIVGLFLFEVVATLILRK
ncbi:MAG: hypothetical protein HY293_20855 [Planctomycetes bacterium]|nr:hypothetical protein [Planctomycetota bacterium]